MYDFHIIRDTLKFEKNCANVSLSCCMSQPLVWYLGRLLSDTPQPATIDLSNDFCSAGGEFSQRGASTNIFPNILKEYISKYFERIYFQIFGNYIFPNNIYVHTKYNVISVRQWEFTQ